MLSTIPDFIEGILMMKQFSFALALSGTIYFIPLFVMAAEPAPSQQTAPQSFIPKKSEEELVLFNPPEGWHLAKVDPALFPTIKILIIGKGKHNFPPSINLAIQPYQGTLKQYLKNIKARNDAEGVEWKDLGSFRTEAGNGNLIQVDRKMEWGQERLMHLILLKNEKIYILTASALKDEFSQLYKQFFNAMCSLRISHDAFEMVTSPQRRTQLKNAYQNLKNQWKTALIQHHQEHSEIPLEDLKNTLFNGEPFQTTHWIPFKETIDQKFTDMGAEWQKWILHKVEGDLFDECN